MCIIIVDIVVIDYIINLNLIDFIILLYSIEFKFNIEKGGLYHKPILLNHKLCYNNLQPLLIFLNINKL